MAEISTTAGGSTATLRSLLDPGGSRLAVRSGTAAAAFTLFDELGSLVGLIGPDRTVASATRYDGYGETVARAGAAHGPWGFRGELDLSPSADPLYAMGARLYAPSTGAFTQPDTYAGSAADPLSMNRFLYAEANPATLIDPTGHKTCTGYNDADCDTLPPDPSKREKVLTTWRSRSRDVRDNFATLPGSDRPPVIDPNDVVSSPWFRGEVQRLADACNGIGHGDYAACDDLDALQGWQRRNEAMFCAANPALCQARRDLALAQAGLVFETGATAVIVAGAWIDPIPGDEVAATGAAITGDGGITAATISRIQQLKDRIAVLLGRSGAGTASTADALLLGAGGVSNRSAPIRSFVTTVDRVYYRVFSGDSVVGRYLIGSRPASADEAAAGLALPAANRADLIQEVVVPAGTRLQSSIATPAFGQPGGMLQYELLDRISASSFGPGVPFR